MSSQDFFQMVIDKILSSIPNATPVADNIKIHGRIEYDHDLILAGLQPDKAKVHVVMNIAHPTNNK